MIAVEIISDHDGLHISRASQTTTGSEERIQALLRNANSRLLAHPEARRRLLQLKAPTVLVPHQGA